MGGSTSKEKKEEVIIGQAGNVQVSGDRKDGGWTTKEIMELGILVLAILVILYFVYYRCQKKLVWKIRREIGKSQEQLSRFRTTRRRSTELKEMDV